MSLSSFPDFVGLLGVLTYLGSYFALQAGFIRGQTYTYAGLNLLAASCVLYDLQTHFNLSSALIQISWIVISLVGIIRLYVIAHRVRFTPEEERFIASKFPHMPRPSARRFLDLGFWVEGEAGTELTREGAPVARLIYLAEGTASVSQGDHVLASCGPNAFIGELTCLDGSPATATVALEGPSRFFSVGSLQLRTLAERDPELYRALQASFTGDARRKLVAANDRQRRIERGIPAA